MSRYALAEIPPRGNGTGVVDARGFVVHGDIRDACLGKTLLEAVTAGCACGAVLDHLRDFADGAGIHDAGVVAGSCSIVRLHKAWVADAVVGGWCSYATIAFLQDDSEDEAGIDASGGSDRLDCGGYFLRFGVGVIWDAKLGT
jgi:hypothetical protein